MRPSFVEQVVDAEARADLGAAHRLDVERGVVAVDDVHPHAGVDGQSRDGTPRVLRVDGVVVAVRPSERHLGQVVDLTMKRDVPRCGIRRIPKHDFFEREAAVRVLQGGALTETRLEIHAALQLVRAGTRIAVPGGVG